MSLATDLTQCQQRLQEAGLKASAEARKLRGLVPVEIYDELMLQLCGIAAGANELKIYLGSLRMMGELEQRPPPVTAESLELSQCIRREPAPPSERDFEHFKHDLAVIGDDTFEERGKEAA